MHKDDTIPLVKTETSMKETLLTMSTKGFGIAAIVDEIGSLVGVITDGDLRRHIDCLLYTSPSPRDQRGSRMPSSA